MGNGERGLVDQTVSIYRRLGIKSRAYRAHEDCGSPFVQEISMAQTKITSYFGMPLPAYDPAAAGADGAILPFKGMEEPEPEPFRFYKQPTLPQFMEYQAYNKKRKEHTLNMYFVWRKMPRVNAEAFVLHGHHIYARTPISPSPRPKKMHGHHVLGPMGSRGRAMEPIFFD